MTFLVTELLKNTEAEAFMGLLDGGSLECYTGSQPAAPTDAPTGTLIVTITLPNPALAAAASGGIADLDTVVAVAAVASGDLGWGRCKTSGGSTVFDGTITLTGGGGDIETDVVAVVINDDVTITNLSYQRA